MVMKAQMNSYHQRSSDMSMSMGSSNAMGSSNKFSNFSSATKPPTMSYDLRTNNYAGIMSNSRSNMGDISMSMKNAPMPSNNLGVNSMGTAPFKMGMSLGANRNAARSSNLSMSASFNVSASSGNTRMIDNY